MDTLRQELIESQKVRSDLLKWKLLIVSAVGGAALGFSDKGPSNAHLALAVLPLACSYVDLLCRNLSLRNKAIGLFFEYGPHSHADERAYENFYRRIHDDVWGKASLESWALRWSTILVCVAIVPVGVLAGAHSWTPWSWPGGLFYASSLVGVVVAQHVDRSYQAKMRGAIAYAGKELGTIGDRTDAA